MRIFTILALLVIPSFVFSQETYVIGNTEYYYGKTYSTTGKPLVKRSSANKAKFLKSLGYDSVPIGYEVDHKIPLSEGGTDDPSNMQLLTIEQHNRKTAKERANNSNSTYSYGSNNYNSTPTYNYSSSEYSNGRTVYTGENGGKYYINSNGNKTYIDSPKTKSSTTYSSPSITSSNTCGAVTKSGSYCKRIVSGGGRCYQH